MSTPARGRGWASFLRHVERTRLLVHVVDISGSEGRDPVEDYRTINRELSRYGDLNERPQLIAANKMDLPGAADNLARLEQEAGTTVYPVSAATGQGFPALLDAVVELLQTLPEMERFPEVPFDPEPPVTGYEVVKEDGIYILKGPSMENLVGTVNFDDYESLQWFHRTLRRCGAIDRLRAAGAQEGDVVEIADMSFDFIE